MQFAVAFPDLSCGISASSVIDDLSHHQDRQTRARQVPGTRTQRDHRRTHYYVQSLSWQMIMSRKIHPTRTPSPPTTHTQNQNRRRKKKKKRRRFVSFLHRKVLRSVSHGPYFRRCEPGTTASGPPSGLTFEIAMNILICCQKDVFKPFLQQSLPMIILFLKRQTL